MSDMFIPKKERIILTVEAIIFVSLVILSSYFTIHGNIFIRMVPMIYFLGIFGVILFNRPVVTTILAAISTIVFGALSEQEINGIVLIFSIYSIFMILCGLTTGYILNLFYENFKLRKFIKYYHKIIYIAILLICILVPVCLNNMVNSNFITYVISKNKIDNYILENYVYSEYYIREIKYVPSYKGGVYEYDTVIDGINIKLNWTNDGKIFDINMQTRKDALNKTANAELNILLKEKGLTNLDIECKYDYSKIASVPDVIKLNIVNIESSEIEDVILFLNYIKKWERYNIVDRIDIAIENANVSISKKDLEEKNITAEYILNGMKYEMLDSKEDL